MSDFDEIVKRQPPDGRDDVEFTYRVDRKRYEELRESVERLIPGLQEQIRRQESVEDMLVANIEVTIETLTRGDELPSFGWEDALAILSSAAAITYELPGAGSLHRDLRRFLDGLDPTKPPDPNPMQSVIDRLRTVLDAAERGVIV